MPTTQRRRSTTATHKGRAATVKARAKPRPKQKAMLTAEQKRVHREYEQAVRLVYKKEFGKARDALEVLRKKYAGDRELLDRVNMYFNVCQIRLARPSSRGTPDPYMEALFQYNEGGYEEALRLLGKASRGSANDSRVVYLCACAHLAKGDREEGLKLLREAVLIDTDNRYRALNDPDLEEIRTDEDFVDALGEEEPGA
ncbi:MAG: tetratricopeptide repeat protein [Acidobacteriota bacterium]